MGPITAKGVQGQKIRLRPELVYPVILRHRQGDDVWSKIRVLPRLHPLIVAEKPERLARRIGKALRLP